jgi:uncharacterized protein (DUF2384 family)
MVKSRARGRLQTMKRPSAAEFLGSVVRGPATAVDLKSQGVSVNRDAVMAHALDTFGSQEKSDRWLHRPNHIFDGKTPLEKLESDPQSVEAELTKIDHGVYI